MIGYSIETPIISIFYVWVFGHITTYGQIPDVTASQPSSEVPVRPTSPCLLLALRRQAVPSREKELFDMFR